jgi:4-diphosphocytidyl-2-C-methyl-D-erythritol kinase
MHARPRAKVNLSLAVGPRGRDGYHPLWSVFLRVGLSDELTVAFGNNEGADVLTVSGLPGCVADGNLVLSAFNAVRRVFGQDLPPLVAHLDKRIPVGGGLGGGSADAAAAVDCALQMWGVGLSREMLDQVAMELGADVPFFARNLDAALVSGRGEKLEPLKINTNPGLLLVTPQIGMSTTVVFKKFDQLRVTPRYRRPQMPDFAHLAEQSASLRDANDLWPAVAELAPELGSIRGELEKLSDKPWLMSGSGSTMFAIYGSGSEAVSSGQSILASESDVLGGAIFNAVDLYGPDPLWRYP